jgi:Lanthionine synthetase C-like protein
MRPVRNGLFDPAEHRQLSGAPWSDQAARDGIDEIVTDVVGAYGGPEQLWPNDPNDLEGLPDVPLRNVYLGAAGVAWAIDLIAQDELCERPPWLHELARGLGDGFRKAPELTEIEPPPAPALLFGESGILLAAEAILRDGSQLDLLADAIARNARSQTLELSWGSPGTLIAALQLWRHTSEPRWREAWMDSAAWLLDQWRGDLWVQDLYGDRSRYTGAGHGFAGNAFALLAGRDLLGDAADGITDRVIAQMRKLAVTRDRLTQWPPLAGVKDGRRPVQWCHGSPGFVTSMAPVLPPADETEQLLAAGGELTWRAGPLRKSAGLCHGASGNAYGLLALWARTERELWLERARSFAMDALADVRRRREDAGHGRYTLFTGDLGVALLLRSLLVADPTFPFIEAAF